MKLDLKPNEVLILHDCLEYAQTSGHMVSSDAIALSRKLRSAIISRMSHGDEKQPTSHDMWKKWSSRQKQLIEEMSSKDVPGVTAPLHIPTETAPAIWDDLDVGNEYPRKTAAVSSLPKLKGKKPFHKR